MIVCPRCSKENQDHYKFCLGCGAELPRDAEQQPKGFSAGTPPGGTPVGGAPPAFGGPPPGPPGGPPRAPGPPPAFGAGPPMAPPGPPMGGPPMGGPPMAARPPGPPMGGPPMAPPGPPMGGPPMGGPPGPPMGGPPMGGPPPGPPGMAARPPGPPGPPAGPPAPGFGAPSPVAPGGNGAGAAPGGATVNCPQCGTTNNKSFKFCGSCGHPLSAVGPTAPMPQAPMPAPAASGGGQGTLVLIRPDGTEGDSIPIGNRGMVGREAMPQFSNDSYLSPRHASFHFGGGTLTVRDETSLNGIYLRIDREAPVEIEDKSIFRIGQEIVRLELLPGGQRGADGVEPMGSPREGLVGRICLVTGRETLGNCYAIPADGLHLGRERGDILFPDDGYVSGLHARIHAEGGKVFLTDVGSSNGTFIRIKGERKVTSGSMLLMGQQLFRIEY